MSYDALERSLDALVEAFEGSKDRVALVGGFGLYLLQISREENRIPILVPALPPARTTRDLDVMLAAELVASPEDFARLREQIEATGFASQERNQFWQWCMGEGADAVVLDILVERIPELYRAKGKVRQGLEGAIFVDKRRARPKGQSSGLHARCTEEAIATFRAPWRVSREGRMLQLATPLSWLVMKLHAFRDQEVKGRLDYSQKHALDVYRIVGLHTAEEIKETCQLARECSGEPPLQEARVIVQECFSNAEARGTLRLREHPDVVGVELSLELFLEVLPELLGLGEG